MAFNTSHVKVYRNSASADNEIAYNFNTSHVKVYHGANGQQLLSEENFNTSHVKVYRAIASGAVPYICISIHLMLKFINFDRKDMCLLYLISIHLMLKFIKAVDVVAAEKNLFQYISC